MLLGPKGPLVCCGYPCRGVLNTPHRAPPSVAKTRTRVPVRPVGAPDHSPGRNPGRAGYPMRSNTGGAVHPFGSGSPLVCWCGYPCRRRNRIHPTGRHHRWRMCHRGTCIRYVRRYGHSDPEARLGGVCRFAPGFRPGLWSGGPTGRSGYVHSLRSFGPVARLEGVCNTPLPWYVHSGPFGNPDSVPVPAEVGLFYVLIGISVRLHLAFASGFLSVCEGKGLYVRRTCQYV